MGEENRKSEQVTFKLTADFWDEAQERADEGGFKSVGLWAKSIIEEELSGERGAKTIDVVTVSEPGIAELREILIRIENRQLHVSDAIVERLDAVQRSTDLNGAESQAAFYLFAEQFCSVDQDGDSEEQRQKNEQQIVIALEELKRLFTKRA